MSKIINSKPFLIALAAASALASAACNTIAGAGQDIEATGAAVEEAAEDVEEDMNN